MRNWTRRHTLVVGIALILLTNAVALIGVYMNRSGEPESTLKLTQRELQRPYGWGLSRENSGLSLRIQWRVPSAERYVSYSNFGGSPQWLDETKMASLGFDTSKAEGKDYRSSNRLLGKEVLLVLELDGPAWQQTLQRARQSVIEQDARLASLPTDKQLQQIAKRAHDDVTREEQENSRLFAVDAGLDLNELRAQYPDRNRYAIVRAQVRPSYAAGPNEIKGYIERISIAEINVPHEYHSAFDIRIRPATERPLTSGRRKFEASVAFGQRLEPWITGFSTSNQ